VQKCVFAELNQKYVKLDVDSAAKRVKNGLSATLVCEEFARFEVGGVVVECADANCLDV
jgi:hypothetical protein